MSRLQYDLNKIGIKMVGPVLQESERGQICREFCLSLIKFGIINLTITDTSKGLLLKIDKDSVTKSIEKYIDNKISYNIVISFEDPKVSVSFLKEEKKETKKILYSYINAEPAYQPWSLFINQYVDEVWVPGEWSKNLFQAIGVNKPIKIVPVPLSYDYSTKYKVNLTAGNSASNITDSTFLFYTIGMWDEQSNMTDLLEAYWHSFTKKEDVCLVIRSFGEDNTKQELQDIVLDIQTTSKESKISNPASTVLLSNPLSYEDLLSMHIRGDCFVSTTRSYPIGLSSVEATLSHKPAIGSYFGEALGIPKEFNCDYTLRPVIFMPGIEYNFKQRWGQPSIVEISKKMREVYDNRKDLNSRYKNILEESASSLKKKHTEFELIFNNFIDV